MSRIIESCRKCEAFTYDENRDQFYCWQDGMMIHQRKTINDPKVFPDFCPLPKLEDKLREAWDASHRATMDALGSYDFHHDRKSFEQWIAEYKNAKSTD